MDGGAGDALREGATAAFLQGVAAGEPDVKKV